MTAPKNPSAVALGKLGAGKSKRPSPQALAARRRNGKLGGRPPVWNPNRIHWQVANGLTVRPQFGAYWLVRSIMHDGGKWYGLEDMISVNDYSPEVLAATKARITSLMRQSWEQRHPQAPSNYRLSRAWAAAKRRRMERI